MTPLVAGLRLYTEAIGSCAAVLTTVAFAPQVVRTWRTGGAGLSWLMLSMLATGVWLWFVYGMLRASAPIVAANGITGLEVLFLAGLKARHARKSS
ncbi:MAG: hypothetical protein LAP40_04655 [Acidobacteriia bacterium]|nr:hypothetical protein [Terriglobia bacterium]